MDVAGLCRYRIGNAKIQQVVQGEGGCPGPGDRQTQADQLSEHPDLAAEVSFIARE